SIRWDHSGREVNCKTCGFKYVIPKRIRDHHPELAGRIHDTRQDGTEHDHRIPGRFTLFMANSPGCLS
ncbi:MAG: hypothetical protein OXC57_04040, partial [Rhodobacteraceae bacterium]|nr:hypothetical protein [Paracoccaceae bacterium]